MEDISKLSKPDFDEACRFIIKLGEKIHGYGPDAARVEFFLNRLTKVFGFEGVFRSTPDMLSFAFSKNGNQWQNIHISDMNGSGIELNRLAKVGDMITNLENGKITIGEADARLDEIDKLPPPWGNATMAAAYVMSGAALPVLLGGGWWDSILSGIFSLVVFFMVVMSSKWGPLMGSWLPLSTAFVAGIFAAVSRYFLPEINVMVVLLSAILVLIPGYPISIGVVEIVTKHISSGLSNLVSELIYLFKQFFGGWLGVKAIGLLLIIPTATTTVPVNPQWLWLFMPMLMVGLGIALQTPYRDFLWASIGMGIAYGGTLLGSDLVGSNFGNLLGTILLVFYTSAWARITKRPPAIVLVPAFILLVSGTNGFMGLVVFAAGNVQTGEQLFMHMFIVALTLAAGLVIGITLLKPEKTDS